MTEDESVRERFAALFRARYAELCHFVLQFVHSRPVAEELVQDLFLRIWERRQSWEEKVGEVVPADGPHGKWVTEVAELAARVG